MKISKKIFLLVTCFCFISISVFMQENVKAKGPLLTTNLYPLYLPYINMTPERARTEGVGRFKTSLAFTYANNCHYDNELLYDNYNFILDMEIYAGTLNIDYGLADKFDMGITLSYTGASSGYFDPFVSSFHKFFNLPNGHRDDPPHNEFNYYIENSRGEYLEQDGAFGGINNFLLRCKYAFFENNSDDLVLSFRYGIKIPNTTDFDPLSSGKVDHSFNLLLEKSFSSFSFYSGIGCIYLGKPENLEIFDFNEILLDYFFAFEFMSSEKLSFYIQLDGSSSPYNTEVKHEYIDLHSASSNFGFKYELRDQEYLSFSLMEEGVSFAAIDFGITLAYEIVF